MSWRTAAAVLVVIFSIVVIQSVLIGPLVEVQNGLNETGDYDSDYLDGNSIITDLPETWANMGLVLIFGIMTWGIWRAVREELTRRAR